MFKDINLPHHISSRHIFAFRTQPQRVTTSVLKPTNLFTILSIVLKRDVLHQFDYSAEEGTHASPSSCSPPLPQKYSLQTSFLTFLLQHLPPKFLILISWELGGPCPQPSLPCSSLKWHIFRRTYTWRYHLVPSQRDIRKPHATVQILEFLRGVLARYCSLRHLAFVTSHRSIPKHHISLEEIPFHSTRCFFHLFTEKTSSHRILPVHKPGLNSWHKQEPGRNNPKKNLMVLLSSLHCLCMPIVMMPNNSSVLRLPRAQDCLFASSLGKIL